MILTVGATRAYHLESALGGSGGCVDRERIVSASCTVRSLSVMPQRAVRISDKIEVLLRSVDEPGVVIIYRVKDSLLYGHTYVQTFSCTDVREPGTVGYTSLSQETSKVLVRLLHVQSPDSSTVDTIIILYRYCRSVFTPHNRPPQLVAYRNVAVSGKLFP